VSYRSYRPSPLSVWSDIKADRERRCIPRDTPVWSLISSPDGEACSPWKAFMSSDRRPEGTAFACETCDRPWRRRGSHICSRQSAHRYWWSCQPYTPAAPLPSRKIPGTHFCERLSRHQGHSTAGKIPSIEKSNDLIGNRTHDITACSIAPQPTALPLAPKPKDYHHKTPTARPDAYWSPVTGQWSRCKRQHFGRWPARILEANAGITSQIRPGPLPHTSQFAIHR
jgi:hypothetical protein